MFVKMISLWLKIHPADLADAGWTGEIQIKPLVSSPD